MPGGMLYRQADQLAGGQFRGIGDGRSRAGRWGRRCAGSQGGADAGPGGEAAERQAYEGGRGADVHADGAGPAWGLSDRRRVRGCGDGAAGEERHEAGV